MKVYALTSGTYREWDDRSPYDGMGQLLGIYSSPDVIPENLRQHNTVEVWELDGEQIVPPEEIAARARYYEECRVIEAAVELKRKEREDAMLAPYRPKPA